MKLRFNGRASAASVLLVCGLAAGCASNPQPGPVPMAPSQSAARLHVTGKVVPNNIVQRLYVTDETAKIAVLDNS